MNKIPFAETVHDSWLEKHPRLLIGSLVGIAVIIAVLIGAQIYKGPDHHEPLVVAARAETKREPILPSTVSRSQFDRMTNAQKVFLESYVEIKGDNNPAFPTNKSEYDQLDDGTLYLGPDGVLKAKKPKPLPIAPIEPVAMFPTELPKLSSSEIYKLAAPAVLVLHARDGAKQTTKHGSGFVIEPGDRFVTNAHVILDAASIVVQTYLNATEVVSDAFVVDRDLDIAILPLPQSLRSDHVLRLATDLPEVGSSVYAIGAPQGLQYTLSSGVVSSVRYNSQIQTDASISHGSSGGPLVDSSGTVVGIVAWYFGSSDAHNLNFAIASTRISKSSLTYSTPSALSLYKSK